MQSLNIIQLGVLLVGSFTIIAIPNPKCPVLLKVLVDGCAAIPCPFAISYG